MTPGTSRRIASASSIFNVPAPPQPVRMPLDVVLPEKIKITFCPRLAICASTCAFAPLPTPTMAITAPTPMMIPSAVSTERILFRRNARSAIVNVAMGLTASTPLLTAFPLLRQPQVGELFLQRGDEWTNQREHPESNQL